MATIFQLGPGRPVECTPLTTALDAAQLMASSRVHCLLVMEAKKLVGIVTAKDMAYRVTAAGLNPQKTLAQSIMTTTPLCLHMDTPITGALATMVRRSVRHLPLLDSEGGITGVLDITRCFHQAMLRLERIATSAHRLKSVLRDVAQDFGDVRTVQAERIVQDVRSLGELIDVPTLQSVGCKPAIYVDSLSSVYNAAQLMVQNSTTALLVIDGTSRSHKVIGIFTSKDICNRVIAKGYDPSTCTVARVLTTSPEFASDALTVSAALRLMYQGHFLNLPVIDAHNDVVGVVSVLQLTYAALTQLGKRDGLESVQKSTLDEVTSRLSDDHPWEKFWSAMDKSNDDIHTLESSVSRGPSRPRTPQSRKTSLNQMISNSRRSSMGRKVSEPETAVHSPIPKVPSSESLTRLNFYLKRKTVVFRISEATTGVVDKISMTLNDNLSVTDELKPFTLLLKEIETKFGPGNEVYYYDDEEDLVTISTEEHLMHAISHAEGLGETTLELVLRRGGLSEGWLTRMWTALSTMTRALTSTWTRSGLMTGVVLLSLGVLLGTTLKPLRRL